MDRDLDHDSDHEEVPVDIPTIADDLTSPPADTVNEIGKSFEGAPEMVCILLTTHNNDIHDTSCNMLKSVQI